MIKGTRVVLRPIRDRDWATIEEWAADRDALWGSFQRFQLDHLRSLREAYEKTGLLARESGLLLVETTEDHRVIGFVRYSLVPFPDTDIPCLDIGFGIADANARGKGYATEATALLLDYLFAGYPAERVGALTDAENLPAQHLLERLGFRQEGKLRRAYFRDGQWQDLALYGLLRQEWKSRSPQ